MNSRVSRRMVFSLLTPVLICSGPVLGQYVEGASRVVDLSRLGRAEAARVQLDQLTKAVDAVRQATQQALKQIGEAKQAFEREPTRFNDARLARTNAEAIQGQDKALGHFGDVAHQAAEGINRLLGEFGVAGDAIEGHVNSIQQDKEVAAEKVAQVDYWLRELAARLDRLIGKDGLLDPDLDAAVVAADAAGAYYHAGENLAEAEAGAAQADLEDINTLMDLLRRRHGQLQCAAKAASAKQATLAQVAEYQVSAWKRRELLDRGAEFSRRLDQADLAGLAADRLVFDLPEARRMARDWDGVDLTNGQSGVDILRRHIPHNVPQNLPAMKDAKERTTDASEQNEPTP